MKNFSCTIKTRYRISLCFMVAFLMIFSGMASGQPSAVRAVMIDPAEGSTLSSSTGAFTWQSNYSRHWLSVGTTGVGSSNIYNAFQGNLRFQSVPGLPTNGRTVYIRLSTDIPGGGDVNGAWPFNDYTYKAVTVGTGIAPATTTGSVTNKK